ncbi:lysophospholipid acyltransferase family protein [Bacteroidota bacterium]
MIQNVNRPVLLFIRSIIRLFFKCYFILFKGFRVIDKKNLPEKGPAIVISNHAAFIDSVFFICSIRRRFVVCGAKPNYFSSRRKRALMGLANILKVESEEQFLADCKTLLDKKEILLIYPEMGRNKEKMGAFKDWAARVAISSKSSVTPCYLYGTTVGEKGMSKLLVGEAIHPEGSPELVTKIFRDKIVELKETV